MLLCVIADDSLSATEIASQIGVLPAQNSKLLAAAEDRG
ncbi:DNA-binding protein, partial [Porphyromonas gingivalis]